MPMYNGVCLDNYAGPDEFEDDFPKQKARRGLREPIMKGWWRKRDRTTIQIADMTAEHIQNTIAMLDRKGFQFHLKRLELVKELVHRRELQIDIELRDQREKATRGPPT